jgi:two-component SAPR family response regulator
MQMDVETAIELIAKAFEKQHEDRMHQIYASVYPHFEKKNFKTFEEFYKPPKKPVSRASAEDILSRAEQILKKAGDKHGDI